MVDSKGKRYGYHQIQMFRHQIRAFVIRILLPEDQWRWKPKVTNAASGQNGGRNSNARVSLQRVTATGNSKSRVPHRRAPVPTFAYIPVPLVDWTAAETVYSGSTFVVDADTEMHEHPVNPNVCIPRDRDDAGPKKLGKTSRNTETETEAYRGETARAQQIHSVGVHDRDLEESAGRDAALQEFVHRFSAQPQAFGGGGNGGDSSNPKPKKMTGHVTSTKTKTKTGGSSGATATAITEKRPRRERETRPEDTARKQELALREKEVRLSSTKTQLRLKVHVQEESVENFFCMGYKITMICP